MSFEIVSITGEHGEVVLPELLAASETVHLQLRPHLEGRYVATMMEVFVDGAEMCVAVERGIVVGVAVFRVYENTFHGKHLYVDDLVTDETQRSRGVGKALLDCLTGIAKKRDCDAFALDSGTQRHRAHAFYFRSGLTISSFHFVKPLR